MTALRHSVRNVALSVIRLLLRGVLRLLSLVFPQSRSVVVSAFPESEGNAHELARALLRRYDGRVVWLTESADVRADVRELADQGMILTRKDSLQGLLRYLRAEAVFFTHGLYGCPRPTSRKPLVNLWHGDGPKATRPGSGAGSLVPSTYLVSGTELFGGYKAAAFELPRERLLVTGNPRTDQMWQPPPSGLEALGIEGDFVLCMPTFRRTRALSGLATWSETTGSESAAGPTALGPLVDALGSRGMQLVVKPHPFDADRNRWEGVVTVTDDDLLAAGVPLYGLLGQAKGLVTDYSSVWVDYLLLDRPMAFLVTDRGSYTRPLVPADVLDWLPGELVEDEQAPFAQFLADLDAGGAHGAVLRKEVAERIGLNPTRTSAEDLVTALAERGALRLNR